MLIPIFPLTVVQFPGVVTPLHIFEPRYQQLMKDIMLGDRTFGILYPGESESELPEIGRAGCTVEVLSQEELPDGRSNILCVGKDRFCLKSLNHEAMYLQAEVDFFYDATDQPMNEKIVNRARELFLRIIQAGRKLREVESFEKEIEPELPEDSIALSFIIAASLDVSLEEKQQLLEMTNTNRRLSILNNHLSEIAEMYELKAKVHKIAKANGSAGKPPLM